MKKRLPRDKVKNLIKFVLRNTKLPPVSNNFIKSAQSADSVKKKPLSVSEEIDFIGAHQ